jgi:hypothetical protein
MFLAVLAVLMAFWNSNLCKSCVGNISSSLICLEAPGFLNVKVHQRHAISEDTWRQVLEFSRSVHEDLSNYDPEGSFLSWEISVYQD